MAERGSLYTLKETQLSAEPCYPGSTIAIRLPAHGGRSSNIDSDATGRTHIPQAIGAGAQSQSRGGNNTIDDEATFAKKHLATGSSLFFRKRQQSPRSFLWRILEDNKVLSIQAVDLARDSKNRDSALTLRFTFPSAIRPGGVCCADFEEHVPFNVFVLTTSNDLYTLTLKPDFFQQPVATESDVSSWCETYLSSSFTFQHPYRIEAKDPLNLFVSLHNGSLLRLRRESTDNRSVWTESFYSEGGWGSSFRNLIAWQGSHTIRHGSLNLALMAATTLASSPERSHDHNANYLFAVCLNHTFKAWNLETGKVAAVKDLLDEERQPNEGQRYTLHPSQTGSLKIINQKLRGSRDYYYLVTYSPKDSGQFKFWAVSDGLESELEISDLFSGHVFEPPTPSSEIWTLAQFEVTNTARSGVIQLWILWKNNKTYRLQTIELDLMRVPEEWKGSWSTVAAETLREEPLPSNSSLDSEDPTDSWVNYLFYPGRYTEATLLTALSIYEQNSNVGTENLIRPSKNLKDLVCSSVGSTIPLGRHGEGGMDYERFRSDTDYQWRRFFRITKELEKQRLEASSLAIDRVSGSAWIATVDGILALRDCSETEFLWHNRVILEKTPKGTSYLSSQPTLKAYGADKVSRMAGLIKAAAEFRESFSEWILTSCRVVLKSEIFQEPSENISTRIEQFYVSCFEDQVSNDDYDQLIGAFDSMGGLSALSTTLIESVVSTIAQGKQLTNNNITLTSFGERVIVRGAQETVRLNFDILFDLLMLVVFFDQEEAPEDNPLGDLDVSAVYVALLNLLREYSVLHWFGKSLCLEPTSSKSNLRNNESHDAEDTRRSRQLSLLQNPWVHNWKPKWHKSDASLSALLTQSVKHVLADIGLSQPEDYNRQVMWMQRTLLRRGEYDLAMEFLQVQPRTSWSEYIKGRLFLATQAYPIAFHHFKKASYNLAHREGAFFHLSSSDDILDATDEEFFNAGLPKYYSHVANLFGQAKAYSFVADAASLGLQFISLSVENEDTQALRTDLLSRSFSAACSISDFDVAYTSLLQYTDKALQRTALAHLIRVLCTSKNPHFYAKLLHLPFAGLQSEVDAFLAQKCHTTLALHSAPPYHNILHAWRLKRGNYRGAAQVLYQRLQRMRLMRDSRDGLDALTRTYLALINTLAVVGQDEAWILVSGDEGLSSSQSLGGSSKGAKKGHKKRRIVTLDDIRREYQDELDRIAMVENDRYAFAGAEEDEAMDLDLGEPVEELPKAIEVRRESVPLGRDNNMANGVGAVDVRNPQNGERLMAESVK